MSNEKQTNEKESACVCLKCYKLKCKARSTENKFCPECGAKMKNTKN